MRRASIERGENFMIKELEKTLNLLIDADGVNDPCTFENKDAIKRWIELKIREIVGTDLIGNWDEKNSKYEIIRPWSGKDNYIELRYLGYWICTINFKYSRNSHYEHWYTVTTYGIKSIEFEIKDELKDKTFEEAKQEIIKIKREDTIAHKKYLQKKHDEIKEFLDKTNLTIDELVEGYSLLKSVDYDDRKKYEEEFNNGKAANWYQFYLR